MLSVTEIFASLQGEGPYMGQPAVFVRLAGCVPPFCAWCDTPQALHAGGEAMAMSPQAVLRAVQEYAATLANTLADTLVVVTGGEPFRQWHTSLAIFAEMLADAGLSIQYETSGKAGIPAGCRGVVVCSPKPADAPSGGCSGVYNLAPESVARADAFKFVVDCGGNGAFAESCDTALAPVLDFIRTHAISPRKVWLMPRGARKDEQLARMQAVWESCVRHGFNFAPRLHILTFDDRKGI
jgi:7-carboxy-7-deazaguanine synthase